MKLSRDKYLDLKFKAIFIFPKLLEYGVLVSCNLILGHFVMPATSSSYGGYIAVWERTTIVLYHLMLRGKS